jgi:hypothetical protein
MFSTANNTLPSTPGRTLSLLACPIDELQYRTRRSKGSAGDSGEREMKNLRALFIGFVATAILATPVFAQTFYGSIVGTITDTSGAAVPAAKVTVSSKATADRRTAETDTSGNYQVLNLVPGAYQINVEANGFKRLERSEVEVQVAGSLRVDASMEVGDVTQVVEVSAQAALIQTENASVSQTVAGRAVTEMALNGRNVMNLVALVPGVTPGGLFMGPQATNGNVQGFANFQAGGGQPNTGGALVDGAPQVVQWYHSISLIPTQDAVQEFRVQLNNVEPEFGQAANGVVSFTTKSGTNGFHGSLYEYLRNRSLNANNFFSNKSGLSRPAYTQNQFGANLGGPIVKNKLFFFFSQEAYRIRTATTTTLTVPTPAERAGDFSNYRNATGGVIPIYDPTTTVPRTPFSGNVIPPTRLSNAAKAFLKYWALPNVAGVPFTAVNNYVINAGSGNSQDQYNFRFDYNMSDKQRIFGRFTHWQIDSQGADPQLVNGGSNNDRTIHNAVLGDSYTLTPNTILDFRLSYLRFWATASNALRDTDLTTLGWPAFYNTSFTVPRSVPTMAPAGFSSSQGGGSKNIQLSETQSASVGLTTIKGKHTIKAGGEYRIMPGSWGEGGGSGIGTFSFTNLFTSVNPASPGSTGAGLASYMLGLGSAGGVSNYTFVAQQEIYAGAYVGDTYRLTNRLTLNIGVRWENPGYFTERYDHATVFQTAAVNPVVQGLGLPYKGDLVLVNSDRYKDRHNIHPHYNLFEPRVGLTYRVTTNDVIRAGFGTTHMSNDLFRDLTPLASPVNFSPTFWIPTLDGSVTAASTLDNPFPNGINQTLARNPSYEKDLLGRQVAAILPDEPPGYMMQWNFGIEHQIGDGAAAGLSYVASRGVHLMGGYSFSGIVGTSLNQIPDQYLSLGSQLLQQVPNPFFGTVQTGILSNKTVPYGQLLTPYPQYAGTYSANVAGYDSTYHSLQAKFQKRFHAGGSLLGSYTLSKNMGDTDNITSYIEGTTYPFGQVQNFHDFAGSRAELSFSVRHRLVVSYVLDFPFGKGKRYLSNVNGVVNRVVSGWGLNGITTLQAGYPLAITAQPSVLTTQFYSGAIRPNVAADCQKTIDGSWQSKLNKQFNTACFTQPAQFAYGNESRTDPTLRAPGIANWDMALYKGTPITETINLQFRAEFFNVANRVQFWPGGTQLGTSQFGVVSQQRNDPRSVQLSLRVNF